MEENVNHLFMRCDYNCSIWYFIQQWICIPSTGPLKLHDHLIQFESLWNETRKYWPLYNWFTCRLFWGTRSSTSFSL